MLESNMELLANSTDTWKLCDDAPKMCDQPNIHDDDCPDIEDWNLNNMHRLVNQGFIDKMEDYLVYEADLMEAQAPLTPKYIPPSTAD